MVAVAGKGLLMARRRHTPGQIIRKLADARPPVPETPFVARSRNRHSSGSRSGNRAPYRSSVSGLRHATEVPSGDGLRSCPTGSATQTCHDRGAVDVEAFCQLGDRGGGATLRDEIVRWNEVGRGLPSRPQREVAPDLARLERAAPLCSSSGAPTHAATDFARTVQQIIGITRSDGLELRPRKSTLRRWRRKRSPCIGQDVCTSRQRSTRAGGSTQDAWSERCLRFGRAMSDEEGSERISARRAI